MKLNIKKTYHFIGIGGIGMSGLAELLVRQGHKVSGSDLAANAITQRLQT
ncbi:MAG: Mur ligase domain-containing protein, partial [Deltaproteobacteria bacterium]